MYIGFGWPTALSPLPDQQDQYIAVVTDGLLFITATRTSVQTWSGGCGRVLLGTHALTASDQEEHGLHFAACWSPARRILAVVTSRCQLLFYGLQQSTEQVLPNSAAYAAIQPFVKELAYLPHDAPPLALAVDARSVVITHADGSVSTTNWSGKVKAEVAAPLEEALALRQAAGPTSTLSPAAAAPSTPPQQAPAGALLTAGSSGSPAVSITTLACDPSSRVVVAVLSDGSAAALRTPEQELHPVADWSFSHWFCGPEARVRCVSIASTSKIVALGTASGSVQLYRLHMPSGLHGGSGSCSQHLLAPTLHLRSLSLADWGHTTAVTGAVSALAWAPDCRALAVGFARQGMVVWTPSGCRVLCTIRQAAADTPRAAASQQTSSKAAFPQQQQQQQQQQQSRLAVASSSSTGSGDLGAVQQGPGAGASLLEGSVEAFAWGPLGYQLLVAEKAVPALGGHSGLVELPLAKALAHHHRVPSHMAAAAAAAAGGSRGQPGAVAAHGDELHVLQAHDRLLLITEAASAPASSSGAHLTAALARQATASGTPPGGPSDLLLHHVPLPAAYVGAHWPLVHAAVSRNSGDVAVACRRGLAVYNRRSERWRLFGDVSQEKRVEVVALGWLDSLVVACSLVRSSHGAGAAAGSGGSSTGAAGLPGGEAGAGAGWEVGNLALASGQPPKGPSPSEILIFPRNHLDFSSLVASYQLPDAPSAMDSAGGYVLVAYQPLDLVLLHLQPAEPSGGSSAASPASPSARQQLVAVRELSLCNVGQPLCSLAVVLDGCTPTTSTSTSRGSQAAAGGSSSSTHQPPGSSSSSSSLKASSRAGSAPQRCVLLRWGGLMSVLDLVKGSEVALSSDVEAFWLSDTLAVKAAGSGPASANGSLTHSRSSSNAHALEALGSHFASPSAPGQLESVLRDVGQLGLTTAPDPEVVEMPWWAYGPGGMQLWFPSLLTTTSSLHHSASSSHLSARSPPTPQALAPAQSLTQGAPRSPSLSSGGHLHGAKSAPALGLVKADSLTSPLAAVCADGVVNEPELEFDQEVYPVGISLADAAIVGVTQRLMRGQHPASPWAAADAPLLGIPQLLPVPESQPVLPALLRRLLQNGALSEALALAAQHASGPHFGRSLEWLLFTSLDLEGSKGKGKRSNSTLAGSMRAAGVLARVGKGWRGHVRGDPGPVVISPLLAAAAELVLAFPQHADVVVSVSRKTDASLWPALFSALGSPFALLDHLQEAGALQSAACFLVVVDRLEGPHLAHAAALKLVTAALKRAQYELVAEILRFLIPPGDSGGLMLARRSSAAGSSTGGEQQQQEQANGGSAAAGGGSGSTGQPSGKTAGAGGAANSSGGSWFGWLWGGGGSSSSSNPGSNGPGAASSAGTAKSGSPRSLDDAAAHTSRSYRRSSGSVARPGGGSWEGSSLHGDGAPALDALHLVGEHAWWLLDQGKFTQLLQLLTAMSFLSGGLVGSMLAYRNAISSGAIAPSSRRLTASGSTPQVVAVSSSSTAEGSSSRLPSSTPLASRKQQVAASHHHQQQQQQQAVLPQVLQSSLAAGEGGPGSQEPPSVDVLLASLAGAMQELPVWAGAAVEQDATRLLEVCAALGAQRWVLALAVLLVDMQHITPFAARHPDRWQAFCQEVRGRAEFYFLFDVVDALMLGGDAAGPTPGS